MDLLTLSKKTEFLYILHSHDFDIDGIDSCYKFGYTRDITSRKFDSCYKTAMKYPCYYKYWYEIKKEPALLLEKEIKFKLRKYRQISKEQKTHGTEMFCCSLDTMRSTVLETLKLKKVNYIEHDNDIFETCPDIDDVNNNELEQIQFIYNIIEKISKFKKLLDTEIDFIKSLRWIYNHIEETSTVSHTVCILCCKKMSCNNNYQIYNEKYGIFAYIGSQCLKKLPHTKYINHKVEQKISDLGLDINIIKDSNSKICNIVKDASQYIYSYILNESTSENSNKYVNINTLTKIFDDCTYNPLDTIGMIVMYMHKSNCTYMYETTINDEIIKWNIDYGKYWHIETVISYLSNEGHDELKYDCENKIFIGVKNKSREEQFIKLWKTIEGEKINGPTHDYENTKNAYINYLKCNIDNKKLNKKYYEKQCKIFDIINKNNISILSGVAGSGKSTLSSYICKILNSENDCNIIQLAPTGKAVSVIKEKNAEINYESSNVSTIHSFICNYALRDRFLGTKPFSKNLFMHIDESSMIDLSLFVRLLEWVIELSKDYNIKLLISGDHAQLPPVGFGLPFNSIVNLKEGSNNLLKLEKNQRINSKLCESIIAKMIKKDEITSIEKYCKYFHDKPTKSKLLKIDDNIKKFSYMEIDNICNKSTRDHCQFITYNNNIRDATNYYIKTGKLIKNNAINMNDVVDNDRIMILKNGYDFDYNLMYYNGEEGLISNIIRNDNNGNITQFDLQPFKIKDGDMVIDVKNNKTVCFTDVHLQMDVNNLLTYAWCKTIHKTQGDGFANVCFILDGISMNKTSFNTAITRVKNNITILYTPEWFSKCITWSPKHTSFLENLYNNEPFTSTQIENNKKNKLIKLLGKYNYNLKYQIEHDINVTNRDLKWAKPNKWWDENTKIKFIKFLNN
jgi:hypothetical protein